MNGKHFDEWTKVKKKLHYSKKKIFFHECEVWWCSLGDNIGTEINGKGDLFKRPVVILRKFGPENFLGIPLSTQKHKGTWFVGFKFDNRDQTAFLVQIRVLDAKRLLKRMGELPRSDYDMILNQLEHLIFDKK